VNHSRTGLLSGSDRALQVAGLIGAPNGKRKQRKDKD
jgi:hypothetical protein